MKRCKRPLPPALRAGILLSALGSALQYLTSAPDALTGLLQGGGCGLALAGLFLLTPLSRPIQNWKSTHLRRF